MLYIDNLQNVFSHYWNIMQTSLIILSLLFFGEKNLLYKRKPCLNRFAVSIVKRS